MSWNYAELSKAAKDAGGPEKLMDLLVQSGRDAGHKDMLPAIGIAMGIGALGYAGVKKVIQYFKRRSVSPDAVEVAKKELIEGINEYDAMHPDSNEVGEDEKPMRRKKTMSERFPGIDWYCDRCGAYLNDQLGFDDYHYVWKCTECGHKNSISADDIYESEEDFRNPNRDR